MKKLLTSLILAVCAAGAFAQNAAPAAAGKPHPCWDAAKAKGLKGADAKKDAEACRAERKKKHEACRAEVKAKGLKKEEAKAAVKACIGE